MFKLFDSGCCPIGIDVGGHSIRVAQLKEAGGATGLAMQGACRIELATLTNPGDNPFHAALQHALETTGFSGKKAVLSLPVSAVHSKSVRLPQMPDSDLSQALRWEAKDRFGFEVGEGQGQLVWFRAGEVRRGTEVKDELLLFAVSGELLNRYINTVTALGLKLEAIDLAPCAAYRSLRRVYPQVATHAGALLDVGHAGSQFMIMCNDELVFYKHIDIGGRSIDDAVADKLGISQSEALQMRSRIGAEQDSETAPLQQALRDAIRGPLEELAREIDMCMRYYVVTFRSARPESIGLIGRQAGCPQVQSVLASALGLHVEEVPALRGVAELGEAARPDRSGEWAIAAGLSLYPVGKARMEAAA